MISDFFVLFLNDERIAAPIDILKNSIRAAVSNLLPVLILIA